MDIKSAQKINNILLATFDEYCNKHNIKYRLEAGTLIGAIRHKGFVPWDDDIDVAMKREEYDKLMTSLKKDSLGDGFLFLTPKDLYRLTKHFHDFTTRIFYTKEVYRTEKKYEEKFNGIFKYLWLDIFILDEYDNNSLIDKKILYGLALSRRYSINYKNKNIFEILIVFILSIIGKFINLEYIIDLYFKKKEVKDFKYYYYVNYPIIYIDYKINKEYEEEYIKVPFNDLLLYVPKKYDEVLNILYRSYKELPKEEDRVASHIELDL